MGGVRKARGGGGGGASGEPPFARLMRTKDGDGEDEESVLAGVIARFVAPTYVFVVEGIALDVCECGCSYKGGVIAVCTFDFENQHGDYVIEWTEKSTPKSMRVDIGLGGLEECCTADRAYCVTRKRLTM